MVIPSRISDSVLAHAGKYRSKARIPALTYLHWANHVGHDDRFEQLEDTADPEGVHHTILSTHGWSQELEIITGRAARRMHLHIPPLPRKRL